LIVRKKKIVGLIYGFSNQKSPWVQNPPDLYFNPSVTGPGVTGRGATGRGVTGTSVAGPDVTSPSMTCPVPGVTGSVRLVLV
jgi:hypothetical protein